MTARSGRRHRVSFFNRLAPVQHPIIRTSTALRVSRVSIPGIIAIFLGLTAVLMAVLTVLFFATVVGWDQPGLFPSYFLTLMLAPSSLISTTQAQPWAVYAIVYIADTLRIILPVFLLGAFVFKLFRVDPLRWRGRLSLESQLRDQVPVLRVRFYNATSSPLVNLRIQVFARVRSTGKPFTVQNIALDVIQEGDPAKKSSAYWAFSRPGVPFTVNVPLGEGLSAKEMVSGKDLVLPARDDTQKAESIRRERVTLFVLASGTSFQTGTAFNSAHDYSLADDLELGHYAEIDVVYDEHPSKWSGWQYFEENRELYVFGYASLAGPDSVASTLGHPVDRSGFSYASLKGWVRDWSVGTDKTSHPERTFRKQDGSEFADMTVVMGIRELSESSCDGAVFPVSRGDLSLLDVRERNYERLDVSDAVTWAGKPNGCVVYTYIPRKEATDRLDAARRERREIVIREGYLNSIRQAFADNGYPSRVRPELVTTPFDVVDLKVEIDPSVADVRTSSLNSSYLI